MDFDDLITIKPPAPNRVARCNDADEHHLYEGAVMVSYAMHLLRTETIQLVRIHPDGEHGKQFDFRGWLRRRGFELVTPMGSTSYGGIYFDDHQRQIVVQPKSGLGDVVAGEGDATISAECKGGIINTRHSGQVSRLYKGLCETVGMLMATPALGRQVAVVPWTEGTLRLATRLAPRCAIAGIEIALVGRRGKIIDVHTNAIQMASSSGSKSI